ncbi:Sensor kinase CckA [subsurface metagenome]
MKQAVSNVIVNAGEAMPDGGIIEITAENIMVDQDNKEAVLLMRDGKYVKICIRDHGTGILEENMQKIFDPYFTTRDRWTQKGLGLGLVIVHSIIKKHDGYLRVESRVGTGTDFFIYLPTF